MADGILSALRKLVRLAEETRLDLSVASEAQAAILHKLDALLSRGRAQRPRSSRGRKRSPRRAR